jgi:uncharacterized protein DUF4153
MPRHSGRHTTSARVVQSLTADPRLPAPAATEDALLDRSIARRLLAAGVGLGLLAEIVLDGSAFGLNIVLLVAATLAAGWLLRRPGRAPDPLDAWLPISALVLGGFVAVRGDPFLAVLDTLGALAFLGASMAAMSGLPVTRRAASAIAGMAAWTLGAVFLGAPRVAGAARSGPITAPGWASGFAARWWLPVVRGLLIGLPLALIFAVFFASADPIFRRGLDDLLGWQLDLGSFAGRAVFTLACAWLAAGLLTVAATGIPPFERASLGAAARTPLAMDAARLGTMEAIIVLAIVDAVIGLFVVLQVAYLFGGLDTLVAAGMTYSDYARRGFFELVAAACLAGAVVVALETTVERRSRPYVAALLALIGLTAIVLVSAAFRLRLYQDAYGWTELRLYVLATIAALAAALAVMTALALSGRMRWVGHGLAVIGLVSLVALNLVAPAGFVAARNVERVIDPSLVPPDGHAGLDAGYLGILPDDAIPVLVEALPAIPEPDRGNILRLLDERRAELATDPALASPAAWNLGRERARTALSTLP